MAKKTVLKQALKYAPLKSDFVKEVATDGTVKTDIQPNMVDMENEIEMEPINVTPVAEEPEPQTEEPPEVPFGDED